MKDLIGILYEIDANGECKLSIARLFVTIAFSMAMAFWVKAFMTGMAIDAPSSLIATLGALLTYIGVGKGISTYERVKGNGNVILE